VRVTALVVQAGTINVTARGYPERTSYGPSGPSTALLAGNGSGGSHGGVGTGGAAVYDDYRNPQLPGAGGTQAMASLIGTGPALFNLLTAKVFSPQELLSAGLVSACTDDVMAEAMRLASQIEAVPFRACANIKKLVRNAPRWSHSDGLAAERTLFCDCMVDPLAQPLMDDVVSGKRAFWGPDRMDSHT
jgi:hypothetical protein